MQLSFILFTPFALLVKTAFSQQIWDVWQTTWDRASLFNSLAPTPPITFGAPGSIIGLADIVVNDAATFQSIAGFGATLTDSSALVLNRLKLKNSSNYWDLLNYLFNATEGQNSAGLSYVRVPLGASDFSAKVYSFNDAWGDDSLSNFNLDVAPSYLFSVLYDIQSINSILKIHITTWSPPAWMKDSGTMNGGSFLDSKTTTFANYLLKCVQGFSAKGIPVYAVTPQNEPENSDSSYPTNKLSPQQEARVGLALRGLLNDNGFKKVKIIGYDHNWDDAGVYPVTLMDKAASAFAGVSFHCYGGNVSQQDTFHSRYPQKEVYFTECAGTIGSDWWSDLKWHLDNIFIGSVERNSKSGLMWNFAGDQSGGPKLPGTRSCGGPGCRPVVTINDDGTYKINQEFYSMAHASKAVIPRDVGGPWGKRIGISVGGTKGWALRVTAFVTERNNPSDWLRYSLVVLNWNDGGSNGWNPQQVKTTIEFRGKQANFNFPVGVTTLWWYAPAPAQTQSTSTSAQETFNGQVHYSVCSLYTRKHESMSKRSKLRWFID